MEPKNSLDIDHETEFARKSFSKRIVDTMKPGADNQDNSCEYSTDSSIITMAPQNREMAEVSLTPPVSLSIPPFRTPAPAPTPATVGHQILVDPSTGQHYLVPSATTHPQPQIFYQPFYYTASPAQPIYYTQGTYLVAPFAGPQQSGGVQNVSMLTHPGHYHVTTSVSSLPSPSIPSYTSSTFHDFCKDVNETKEGKLNVPDAKSLQLTNKHPALNTFTQLLETEKCNAQRAVDCSQDSTLPKVSRSFDAASLPSSDNSPSPRVDELQWTERSYGSVNGRRLNEDVDKGAYAEESVKSRPKAVRMDIDLNSAFISDEVKRKETNKAATKVPSTAFTVAFDSSESCSMSLQDAAKKSGTRRLLRRNLVTTNLSSANMKLAGSSDPKRYLLSKMLMGDADRTHIDSSDTDVFPSLSDVKGAPEADALSETGTYVVDDDNRLVNHMISSQQLDDDASISSSSCSDRTVSPSSTVNFSQVSAQLTVKSPNTSIRSKGFLDDVAGTKKNSPKAPLRGLTRPATSTACRTSCRNASKQQNASPLSSTPITRLCSAPSSSTRYHPSNAFTRFSDSFQPSSSSASPTSGTTFRRGEGGRFSMRASCGPICRTNAPSAAASSNKSLVTRPPFRVGVSRGITSSGETSQKESAEMTAWLRRKDYNPMKAAAEARRMQQLKSRLLRITEEREHSGNSKTDQYTSSRSISFHQGSKPDSSRLSQNMKNFAKPGYIKQNRGVSRDIDIYGSDSTLMNCTDEVKDEIKKLQRDDNVNRSELPVMAVEKTLQELSLKCNRSIELIRKAHHGRLTGSVESLLQIVVDPCSNSQKTITEQLDQLSSAFDAIQKYLEVYSSASTPASPTANSPVATPSHSLRSISPAERNVRNPEQAHVNKDFLGK